MARPELGTKRVCPNCGAKYYDLNRDPITCPKCEALFATGAVAVSPVTAKAEEEEVDSDDEGVELVPLEAADPESDDDDDDADDVAIVGDDDDDVTVEPDDDALIDDDEDDEVSDVVVAKDDDDDER